MNSKRPLRTSVIANLSVRARGGPSRRRSASSPVCSDPSPCVCVCVCRELSGNSVQTFEDTSRSSVSISLLPHHERRPLVFKYSDFSKWQKYLRAPLRCEFVCEFALQRVFHFSKQYQCFGLWWFLLYNTSSRRWTIRLTSSRVHTPPAVYFSHLHAAV